jgi:hypothetical protein
MKEKELFQTLETGKAVTITYLHINNKTSKIANMDMGRSEEHSTAGSWRAVGR